VQAYFNTQNMRFRTDLKVIVLMTTSERCLDSEALQFVSRCIHARFVDDLHGLHFHAQNDDGTMRNFMSYQRDFLDNVGSDEALAGRSGRVDTRVALCISLRTSEKLHTSFLNAQRYTRTNRLSLRGLPTASRLLLFKGVI